MNNESASWPFLARRGRFVEQVGAREVIQGWDKAILGDDDNLPSMKVAPLNVVSLSKAIALKRRPHMHNLPSSKHHV